MCVCVFVMGDDARTQIDIQLWSRNRRVFMTFHIIYINVLRSIEKRWTMNRTKEVGYTI